MALAHEKLQRSLRLRQKRAPSCACMFDENFSANAMQLLSRHFQFIFPKTTPSLIRCRLVLSADNLHKQFGPRSGPSKCLA